MHVDRGMSALSIGIGSSNKAWFTWPPIEHNEEAFNGLLPP